MRKLKIIIDVLLTIALLFLMGYQFWGDEAHEWAGAAMFVLFIVHHILNRSWHKNLFRGSYSPSRIFLLVVDLFLSAAMLGICADGAASGPALGNAYGGCKEAAADKKALFGPQNSAASNWRRNCPLRTDRIDQA